MDEVLPEGTGASDAALLDLPLPGWMTEARLIGRWLANPKSRVLAQSGYNRIYSTPESAHRATWQRRRVDRIFPVLVLTEDVKAELLRFLSNPGWPAPCVDATWLLLPCPLGRAFAEFLGDRPAWLVHGSARSG